MSNLARNACLEAFNKMCDEVRTNGLVDLKECQYWQFERGYRAAIQALIDIMETGFQEEAFVSPKLQAIAEKLLAT